MPPSTSVTRRRPDPSGLISQSCAPERKAILPSGVQAGAASLSRVLVRRETCSVCVGAVFFLVEVGDGVDCRAFIGGEGEAAQSSERPEDFWRHDVGVQLHLRGAVSRFGVLAGDDGEE